MWLSEMKWKSFYDSLKPSEMICSTCKYCFHDKTICVNDGSPVKYGGAVSQDFTCDEWEPDFDFFNERLRELETMKNVVPNRPL